MVDTTNLNYNQTMINAGIAIAYAEKKRLENQEEESMTNYQPDDLNGWEFKILRANVPIFENPIKLKKVIEEEATAGWIFLEKFDQCRLRFKRKTSHRENDHKLTINPYRTVYGMSQYRLMFYVLAASVVGAMAFVFIMIAAIAT